MKKKLFSLLLAGVILASSFSSVSATTEESSFKSGITVTKFAQGFIDSVNPDKNLSTGEVIKVYNEDELLSGFCVSLYQEEQPSGYVVIKNTVDGPTISEFATELGMKNIYSELYEGYYHDHAEVSQENATILNHQGNMDKKLYSFGPNEYMISVKNIEKGQTDTQYYDYIGQTLDQTTFEQSKLSAKQLKKQAKEEQKQKREALKTLKQEIKNQQQSVKTDPISTQKDAVIGAVSDAVNEDFQKNPVTLAEVEAAELELEKTIEYIPFPLPQANTNRKYDDGEQVICDYDRFLEIKGETTDSVMLPGVFNYQIYKQKDFTSTIKKFACGVVAMTNMASYYQGNGYGNALKNDSYIETFERLWALSNTKIHKIENGVTYGETDRGAYCAALVDYFSEQGYRGVGNTFWLNRISDYFDEIKNGYPCILSYSALFNGKIGGHAVFVAGAIKTTSIDFLYVADGWNNAENHHGDFKYGHRYLNFDANYKSREGRAFRMYSNPDYK